MCIELAEFLSPIHQLKATKILLFTVVSTDDKKGNKIKIIMNEDSTQRCVYVYQC